jgi:hypothetical protein
LAVVAGNLKARKTVRVVVYAMLLLSAGSALLVGERLWQAARSGTLPVWLALVPPVAFTAFVAVYSVDRWLLVRRSNYPLSKAFFQIAFALVFLTLLWPQHAHEYRNVRRNAAADPIAAPAELLNHGEAGVRALACELFGLRAELNVLPRLRRLAAADPSPGVRAACAQALDKLDALPQAN